MSEIRTPFEIFRDTDGTPLDGGYVYIGIENQEPITHPASVFWDAALTIAAAQPIRTIGGYPVRAGAPAQVYVAGNYSITVKNKNGELVATLLSAGTLEALLAAVGGAGLVGYDEDEVYPDGTVGHAISSVPSAYVTYAEVQNQTYVAFASGGTAPAFTLTPSPALTALADGQELEVAFGADGTTGSNTLNVSGLGAKALKQYDSSGSLVSGVVKNGFIAKVRYNGTYWVILNPLPAQTGQHGACIMVLSGVSLVLKPWGGNGITINGVNYQIPSAGVSLAVTGMTAGTLYYIYAYMNSGTMTLEKSATAHATHTDGVEIKSGDATRTLVGMARPVAGPAFSATQNCMLVRSWFNRTTAERRPRSLQPAEISRTNGNYAEVGTTTRVEFLTWADETTSPSGLPCLKTTLSSNVAYAKLMIDGADLAYRSTFEQTTSSESYVYKIFGGSSTYEAASIPAAVSLERCPLILREGYHYTSVQMHGNSVYLDADSAKSYGNTEIVIE